MLKLFKVIILLLVFVSLDANSEDNSVKKQVDTHFLTDGKDTVPLFFQKPNSDIMHQIIKTHNVIFVGMMVIFALCCAVLLYIIYRFREKNNPNPSRFTHNTPLEVAWTVIPLLIVFVFSVYNLRTLHHEEIQEKYDMTIKIVGHQWYWTYEYPGEKIKFDSYMKKDDELVDGDKRLLTVDNPIFVPKGKNVKIIVTAEDVIHSWAIPAFGVKKDAVPGRLNETWFRADETGVFYGQCSELCGLLHGFMPIEVHVVSDEDFATWVASAKSKFSI
jgi:cytochrome c oxidase subunit 2